MGRGERIGSKNNSRGHVGKRNVKSDDSDEDYMLEEDQSDDQSDDLDLLVVDASDEESLGSFVEEENVRKVVKPKSRKQPIGQRKNGIKRSRKRTRMADEEEDDEDYEVEKDDVDADSIDGGDGASLDNFVDEEEEENFRNVISPKYQRSSIGQWKTGIRSSRKRRMIADDEDCEAEKGNDVYADSIDGCGGGGNAASLGSFVDEEEEENVRKVFSPKSHKRSIGLTKNGSKSSRKRKRIEDDEGDDEDYEEEEEDNDVDSIDGGSFSNFIDEEEEESSRKIVKTELHKRSTGQKKIGNRSLRKRISDDEDFEEEYNNVDADIIDVAAGGGHGGANGIRSSTKKIADDEDFEEEDNDVDADTFNAVGGSGSHGGGGPCSDAGSHGSDDDEEVEYEDDEDDEDDEFTPEELDFFDEEEEHLSPKGKRGRGYLKSKGTVRSRKRKTGTKLLKNPEKNRREGSSRSSKPTSGSRSSKSTKKVLPSRGRCKRRSIPRKKKAKTCSDSDFVSTEPSDCEFTISEEEREQVREANEFCRRTRSNMKSSKPDQQDTADNQVKNRPRRKGKEKAEEIKSDVGKQVCGICLTEEGKNTMRGTLDCCGHFFCFACIMEWSKVESRCPLCKQRFSTISKPARSGTRIDLRNVVIHVPERDQVYQPSEEELRDYLDPYENVYCTECHEGGDDALMLLCDVCDSPAHTYCVGLGRRVPEGNWYCEGCRPSALGSTSSQAPDLTPTQRLNNNSFNEPTFENMAEIDLNITIPETPVTPVNGFLLSPRQPLGASLQAPPPISGVGVSTLSGRRRVHRLQYLMSSNRIGQIGMRFDRTARSSSFETSTTDVGPSYHAEYFIDRLHANPSSSHNLEFFPGGFGLIRGQPQPLQAPAADTSAYDGIQLGGVGGINLELNRIPGREFLHPCTSRLTLASGISTSSFYNQDMDQNAVKQQVQSLVKNQLKNICRDMGLGHDTLKQIVVSSTNTILATCGLGNSGTEVYEMQPPLCLHTEALLGPQTSVIRGCCQACVDSFVMEVVRTIMDVKMKAAEQLSFRNF